MKKIVLPPTNIWPQNGYNVVFYITNEKKCLSFRALLSKQRSSILLNFCTALLGLSTTFVFVTAIDESPNTPPVGDIECIIVAAFLHYFALATAFWTAAISLYDFWKSMHRFITGESFYVIKASFVAWGTFLV